MNDLDKNDYLPLPVMNFGTDREEATKVRNVEHDDEGDILPLPTMDFGEKEGGYDENLRRIGVIVDDKDADMVPPVIDWS